MKSFFQRLGRSIMLPVAVLPAAAILAGIGNWILGFSENNIAGTYLLNAGTSILDNLAIIFAVGIAIGLSRDKHGAAALRDRKSTRLNSSHVAISYAVFCLKKKKYF